MQGRPKRLQNVGSTDAIAIEAPCVVKWLALRTVGQELGPQFAEQLHVEPWGHPEKHCLNQCCFQKDHDQSQL